MNKLALSASLITAAAILAISPATRAANTGTITINGKVVDDTCAISVNGGTADGTVTLPTVMTSALASPGATAGDTNFDIALTGCDTNIASAQMAFGGTNVDTTNGNLNTTGTGQAANVQVRLLSGSNVINLSTQANAPAIAVANGDGNITLTAQYYANAAAAGAGLVNTSATFTLTYQ